MATTKTRTPPPAVSAARERASLLLNEVGPASAALYLRRLPLWLRTRV